MTASDFSNRQVDHCEITASLVTQFQVSEDYVAKLYLKNNKP